ncbi:MAG: hypothetical protein MI753_03670 [Hyphomicrobiales bacterium]|nr:hypothetical protein [Hyphomicrobiales bacterium]
MQINGATDSLAAMLAQIRQQQEPQPATAEAAKEAAPASPDAPTTQRSKAEILQDIAGRYDVRSMTYQEIQDFSNELLDAGLITTLNHLLITTPPIQPGEPFVDPGDKKFDVLGRVEAFLAFSREDNTPGAVREMENLAGLLKSMEDLRSGERIEGVDLYA